MKFGAERASNMNGLFLRYALTPLDFEEDERDQDHSQVRLTPAGRCRLFVDVSLPTHSCTVTNTAVGRL